MNQAALFDGEPVPRTRAGTHLERTGADARGPLLEVCDGCGVDASWNPGTVCPTPEVHSYDDPGAELGEDVATEDEQVELLEEAPAP